MKNNILEGHGETLSYELLDSGDNHAIAEVEGERYLIEQAGFDEETQQYLFDIIDSDTVCVDGDHGYKGPNRVALSANKVETSEYRDVVDTVLKTGGALRPQSEGLEDLRELY